MAVVVADNEARGRCRQSSKARNGERSFSGEDASCLASAALVGRSALRRFVVIIFDNEVKSLATAFITLVTSKLSAAVAVFASRSIAHGILLTAKDRISVVLGDISDCFDVGTIVEIKSFSCVVVSVIE